MLNTNIITKNTETQRDRVDITDDESSCVLSTFDRFPIPKISSYSFIESSHTDFSELIYVNLGFSEGKSHE